MGIVGMCLNLLHWANISLTYINCLKLDIYIYIFIIIIIIIIIRGFERKCTTKKLREICAIYHFFFVKLNSVVSK